MGTVAKLAAGGATHLIASTAYATCTTAAGTAAKVATIQDSQAFTLIIGTTIHVYFQYANTTSAPTLNVNSTGALPIYKYGTTAVGTDGNTSWSAGAVVSFTYNKNNLSTGCWVMNDHIDNTDTDTQAMYVHYYNNVKAKTAWSANKIIVGDASGYSMAESGVTFNIAYPILWTVASVSAGGFNYSNVFSQIIDRDLTNIKSGFTSTANSGIYLVVTISGVIATVDSTIITDTLPTSEDGKVYIRLGKLGSNSNGSNYFIFEPVHPMFWYYHGEVVPYDGTANPLLDMIYPVGSIYMSVNNVNPGTYLTGTTWEAWGAGRVPVGVDTTQTEFDTVEETGGEKTHLLTGDESGINSHRHEIPSLSGTATATTNLTGDINFHASELPNIVYSGTGVFSQSAGGSTTQYRTVADLTAHSGAASKGVIRFRGNHSHTVTTNSDFTSKEYADADYAHNNLQPYITCYMWKRTA